MAGQYDATPVPGESASARRKRLSAQGYYSTTPGNKSPAHAAEAGGAGTWYDPSTYSGQLAAANPNVKGITAKSSPGQYNSLLFNYMQGGSGSTGSTPNNKWTTYGGGGGGGRGGGGGGGAAAPQLTQAQLDQLYALMRGAQPGSQTANQLDLPDYQAYQGAAFDPSMWQQLQGNLDTAVASDRAAAGQAYGDLTSYLNTNYRNAFAGGPQTTMGNAPGMDQQAMNRMLQAQNVNPNALGEQRNYAGGADQAFGNLLAILGGNEQQAQQNRLGNVQMDANTTNRALDMAALSGKTGIGLQQGQAQQAWKQRQDDQAFQEWQNRQAALQQEAMQNWQRGNTVADTNLAAQNAWKQGNIQDLIALLPQLIPGGLNFPDLAGMGLA